ncbi:MAG: type IV secretion system protein, partial [Alphaproteobacteria bacterium]|nr:type IV secretion system protein [Alphaproteobacteria bacterium]
MSSGSFGSLTVKTIEVYANPFGDLFVKDNVVIKPKKESAGGDCPINEESVNVTVNPYNYWFKLDEKFNNSHEYTATIVGSASFCAKQDMLTPSFSTSKFSELMALDTRDSGYVNGSKVPVWYDVSEGLKNPFQGGLADVPSSDCVGKSVTITSSSNSQNYGLGNYNTIASTVSGNVTNVSVPLGCAAEIHLGSNYTKGSTFLLAGDHALNSQNSYSNTCTDNVRIYFSSTYKDVGKGDYSWVEDVGITNDQITHYDIPAGCAIKEYMHGSFGTDMGNLYPSPISQASADPYQVSSFRIFDSGSNYDWKNNLNSIKVSNNTIVGGGFTNTTDMEPVIHFDDGTDGAVDIFGYNGGIFFDGYNDFYNYDDYSALLANKHLIFMVIDPSDLEDSAYLGTGTLFASVAADLTINDRLYMEEGNLKFYSRTLANIQDLGFISGSSLLVINRSASSLLIKLNGTEKVKISAGADYSGLASSSSDKFTYGTYWGSNYYPKDFYKGYIGYIASYMDSYDIDNSDNMIELQNIESYLMVSWGISNCDYGHHLDKLRLRVGEFEADEGIFDAFGNLTIPDSYQSTSGDMYLRYKDPDSRDDCVNDRDIYKNNDGFIKFNLKIVKDTSFIGGLYDYFIVPIESYITGSDSEAGLQELFFKEVTGADSIFSKVLKISLTFYVIMTAISYLLGIAKFNQYDLLVRIIKVGLILSLVSAGSWEFFNEYLITFFRDGAVNLATNISVMSDITQDIAEIDKSESNIKLLFDNLDVILAMFLSSDVNAKILSLTFSPPFTGFLMVLMFYIAIYNYIHIVAQILIIYVSIFIMMTLAFLVAPLFIIFSLFNKTQSLFFKWLDLLIGYFMQYIFLAAVIGIFSWIILSVFIELMGFTVCWRPIFFCCSDSAFAFSILEFFRPVAFDYTRFNMSMQQHYVPDFWDVAIFLFFMYFFREFFTFVMDLAARLSSGVSVSGLAKGISGVSVSGLAKGINQQLGTNNIGKNLSSNVDRNLNRAGAVMSGLSRVGASFYGGQGIRNPYRMAKEFAHRNKFLGIDRAGLHSNEKLSKINTIKKAVREGKLNAVKEGKSFDKSINDSVKSSLANMNMSNKDINKVLNSPQLKKDISSAYLSTNKAKELLTKSFDDKFFAMKKAGKSQKEAREAALSSVEDMKGNIAKNLSKQKAIHADKPGKKANTTQMARMAEHLNQDFKTRHSDTYDKSYIRSARSAANSAMAPLTSAKRVSDMLSDKVYGSTRKSTKVEEKKLSYEEPIDKLAIGGAPSILDQELDKRADIALEEAATEAADSAAKETEEEAKEQSEVENKAVTAEQERRDYLIKKDEQEKLVKKESDEIKAAAAAAAAEASAEAT